MEDIQRRKRILLFAFMLIWTVLAYFAHQEYQGIKLNSDKDILLTKAVETVPVSDKDTNEVQELIQETDMNAVDVSEEVLNYFKRQEGVEATILRKEGGVEPSTEEQKKDFFAESLPEECGMYPCFSSKVFLEIFDNFEKKFSAQFSEGEIYAQEGVDEYLQRIAEGRGYKKRTLADISRLVRLGNLQTLPEVKAAYLAMSNEMKQQGISLHFVSGFRSFVDQRAIFKRKLGKINEPQVLKGAYDEKIMDTLNLSALPGYSKHHTGYAVDFGCGADYLVYKFAETQCYDWMSKNNFENTKRFGFLPSYPNGVVDQGPNPEPWEYVWVGEDVIKNQKL